MTPQDHQNEISLIDFLLIFARQKRVILKTILYVVVFATIFAILSPNIYTTQIDIIPETKTANDKYSRALSSLRSIGIGLNQMQNSELSMEAYPKILTSQYVLFQLLDDSLVSDVENNNISIIEYLLNSSDWRSIFYKYTLGLPKLLLSLFKGTETSIYSSSTAIRTMTQDEEDAFKILKDLIEVDIDFEANLISVFVSSKDPIISKVLANKLISHFKARVRSIHTEKSKENVEFLQNRLLKSKLELEKSESELARFVDENLSLQSATSKIAIERKQRQVDFNVEIYSELQTQLTAAEIEHQRSIPVLSIIDNPIPSNKPSEPGRKKIVLLSVLIGVLAGLIIAFIRGSALQYDAESITKEKVEELKNAFSFKSFFKIK